MSASAGWYPDNLQAGRLRYWDGRLWTEQTRPASASTPAPAKVPRFKARAVAEAALSEVAAMRAQNEELSLRLEESVAEVAAQRDHLQRLGALELAELEAERERLARANASAASAHRRKLDDELSAQRETLSQETADHKRKLAERDALHKAGLVATEAKLRAAEERLAELASQIVVTEETAILQEVGVYDYSHPLQDSTAYKAELAKLQTRIKETVRRNGGAIDAATDWTVNGSQAQGRKMVSDISKLMLRAYNAEADNLVRGLRPFKLQSSKDRLDKVATTIERLGKSMSIRVSRYYHDLRIRELELTADFREMLAREKEKERAERERLREEKKVQAEIEREREKLRKERQHYENALEALVRNGDEAGAERLRAQLADVDQALADVDYRAANARAGYVYVISNLGSFGERMIKVGMTRRLEPLDRIRELSDASVPFNFDVHALFFADDAVGIETQMHQRLAAKRVNRVNMRREFFYATPAEAKGLLMELAGDLLTFEEAPEALEFHQSQNTTT